MLNKKQLEDAAKCMYYPECEENGCGYYLRHGGCAAVVAQTALAYREALEQAKEDMRVTISQINGAECRVDLDGIEEELEISIGKIDKLIGGEQQ